MYAQAKVCRQTPVNRLKHESKLCWAELIPPWLVSLYPPLSYRWLAFSSVTSGVTLVLRHSSGESWCGRASLWLIKAFQGNRLFTKGRIQTTATCFKHQLWNSLNAICGHTSRWRWILHQKCAKTINQAMTLWHNLATNAGSSEATANANVNSVDANWNKLNWDWKTTKFMFWATALVVGKGHDNEDEPDSRNRYINSPSFLKLCPSSPG